MAGGKETPRQKMIGMMYLVLTALLALNVSKAVLEAFAAIEDNTQRSNENLYYKGQENKNSLQEELLTLTQPTDGPKKQKIKTYLDIIDKIDKESGKVIQMIDELKFELLTDAKEEYDKNSVKPKDKEALIWSKFDPKEPAKPIRFNLFKVQNKDNFDVPMHVLVGSDINNITSKKGMDLWNAFKGLRNKMCEIAATYNEGDGANMKKWSLKLKDINEYEDSKDLQKQLRKLINAPGNKVNPEDTLIVQLVYELMSKKEMEEFGESKTKVHWLGRTFDHSPLVGALASLSSLQNDILQAREKLIAQLKSKVSTGEFSFNKIEAFVAGDAVVTQGGELNLKVTMAAYDSDKKPTVVVNGGATLEPGEGVVGVKKTVNGTGEQTISGSVTILSKSGVPNTKTWEHKYIIAAPQGSISLPEMMVLYKNWDNKIVPVVAGAVSSSVAVEGGTASPLTWKDADGNSFKGYVVKVAPSARQVIIKLSGKDKDGKSKSFGTYKYKAKPFPTPAVQGGTISKSSGTKVIVSLGADSPFTGVSFTVTGGEITIGDKTESFTGDRIPADKIAKAKVGKKVAIDVFYTRNGVKGTPISSSLKIVP